MLKEKLKEKVLSLRKLDDKSYEALCIKVTDTAYEALQLTEEDNAWCFMQLGDAETARRNELVVQTLENLEALSFRRCGISGVDDDVNELIGALKHVIYSTR